MSLYLEAVVVCVNYSDFLAHTLPANRNQFNRMVIVTSTADRATQQLCAYYNVECVQTDVFYTGGDVFAKARGINAGLERLSLRGSVVHMDADIYMPPLTRSVLNNLTLDPTKLYGADRLMCPSAQAFAAYLDEPPPIQADWVFVHPTAFPMGVRLAQYHEPGGGYVPIGFFQLWNPAGSGVNRYPETHGTAARTDFKFATSWPAAKRQLLPEVILVHLESAPGMALNWEGRKTPLFRLAAAPTPEPTAAAAEPAPLPSDRPSWLRRLCADLRRLLAQLRLLLQAIVPPR